jgi:hypothetical protein
MTTRTWIVMGVGLAVSIAGGACQKKANPPPKTAAAPVKGGPPPLCLGETVIGLDRAPRDRIFPAEFWFGLLVQGYKANGEFPRPTRDCRSGRVAVDLDGCGGEGPQATKVYEGPLSDKDLVITSPSDGRRLVWVITDRMSDGQAQGPVAIAELMGKQIAVRALGTLRAYPGSVSLRLEKVRGGTVLVADGVNCQDNQPQEACDRAVRLVPLVGDAFVPKSIVDERGNCLGSSSVQVRASGVTVEGRKGLKYRLNSSVNFSGEGLIVREELSVDRKAPPGAPEGSYVIRQQADRQLIIRDGNLVSSTPSLLARWLERNAATQPAER